MSSIRFPAHLTFQKFAFVFGLAVLGWSTGAVSGESATQESTKAAIDVVEGPKLTWNLSLWGTPRPGTRIADSISEHIVEATKGNWKFVVNYGEALSKARENLDGISIGAFEAALICNFYHPQKNPALMVLTLPFLPIQDWDNRRAAGEAVYQHEDVKKEMRRWGAMIYTSSFLPNYEIMGRGKPPLTLEDWKGLNVRAGGGIGRVMAKMGATPTSTTATEVYTGLQLGTMDAAAFPFTYGHVSYRLHEVSDWYTRNLSPGTADCPVVFSIQAYERLPDQYKQVLEQIRESVIADQRKTFDEVDKINLPMLQEKLQEIVYPEQALEELRNKFGQVVIEEWISDNEKKFDARGLVETVFEAVGQEYHDPN